MPWVTPRGEGDAERRRQAEAERREKGRRTPGSVYYRAEPPDDDDPWMWCHQCEMWHPHEPCF